MSASISMVLPHPCKAGHYVWAWLIPRTPLSRQLQVAFFCMALTPAWPNLIVIHERTPSDAAQ